MRRKGIESLKDAVKDKLTSMGVVLALLLTMTFMCGQFCSRHHMRLTCDILRQRRFRAASAQLSRRYKTDLDSLPRGRWSSSPKFTSCCQLCITTMSLSILFSLASVLASVWVFDLLNVVLHTDEDIETLASTRLGQVVFDMAQIFAVMGYGVGVASTVDSIVVFLLGCAVLLMSLFLACYIGGCTGWCFVLVSSRVIGNVTAERGRYGLVMVAPVTNGSSTNKEIA